MQQHGLPWRRWIMYLQQPKAHTCHRLDYSTARRCAQTFHFSPLFPPAISILIRPESLPFWLGQSSGPKVRTDFYGGHLLRSCGKYLTPLPLRPYWIQGRITFRLYGLAHHSWWHSTLIGPYFHPVAHFQFELTHLFFIEFRVSAHHLIALVLLYKISFETYFLLL